MTPPYEQPPFRLTPNMLKVLWHLAQRPNADTTVAGLADRAYMQPAAARAAMDRLRNHAWLECTGYVGGHQRNQMTWKLTPKGAEQARCIIDAHQAAHFDMLGVNYRCATAAAGRTSRPATTADDNRNDRRPSRD